MPNIVRENIDNLNAVVTVTITRDDIQPKVKSELNKFRQKAQLKGFRKGKTPINFIKKMYGQSIMVDIVNKTLEKELNDFLTEEKIDMLGQPIPSDSQGNIDLNINGSDDFIFKFDVGIAPEFEVAGVDANTKLSKYKVEIPESMIDTDLEAARKRVGKRESVEDDIQEGDLITINADEMDGDALKLDGWATTFTILYNDIKDEAVKTDLATKKKGDKFHFNVMTIEGEKEESHVRKYLLNVEEADGDVEIGNHFEGTINEVSRMMPADLDEEFFNKYFGEESEVKDEAGARDFIRKDIEKHYDNQAESLLFRDIQEHLLEENNPQLPDEFLKRWLVTSNEKNTPELVEQDYENFSKSLRWTLTRGKLAEKYGVEVNMDDVTAKTKQQVLQYYGMYLQDEGLLNNMVQRMLQDKNHVQRTYEDILVDLVFKKVKEEITVEDKPISKEDFEQVLEEARAAAQAAELAAQDMATEEE